VILTALAAVPEGKKPKSSSTSSSLRSKEQVATIHRSTQMDDSANFRFTMFYKFRTAVRFSDFFTTSLGVAAHYALTTLPW